MNRIEYGLADELALLIRRAGGAAWVEREEDGRDIVLTDKSRRWVSALLRREGWISL